MSLGRVCLAHPDHHPAVPIDLHHVHPRARGGRDGQAVQLCANAHGQVHALLDDIEAHAVSSPFATTREVVDRLPRNVWADYSGPVRLIAYKGWLAYGLGFLNGMYAEQFRHWTSAGVPKSAGVPHFADREYARTPRWRQALARNGGPAAAAKHRGQQKAPDRSRGRFGN